MLFAGIETKCRMSDGSVRHSISPKMILLPIFLEVYRIDTILHKAYS